MSANNLCLINWEADILLQALNCSILAKTSLDSFEILAPIGSLYFFCLLNKA